MTAEGVQDESTWPTADDLGSETRRVVYGTIFAMPKFFVFSVFLITGFSVLGDISSGDLSLPGLNTNLLASANPIVSNLLGFVCTIGTLLMLACAAAVVYRYTLLQETVTGLSLLTKGYVWKFLLLTVCIGSLLIPVYLPLPFLIRGISFVVTVWIELRLALVFPAIAIDEPSRSIINRARQSFRRTKGHLAAIFSAYVIVMIPALFIVLLLLAPLLVGDWVEPTTYQLIQGIISPTISLFATICAAAVASCAYRVALQNEAAHGSPEGA